MNEPTSYQEAIKLAARDRAESKRGEAVFFQFRIGQEVLIPLDVRGVVLQRCDRGAGVHDYQVCWWAESKRYVEWLYQHELRAA